MKTSKREIALRYFPMAKAESAEKHLMVWVKRCKELLEELYSLGYRDSNKTFTPKQVKVIEEYLGDP